MNLPSGAGGLPSGRPGRESRWYHSLILIVCVIGTVIMGFLDLLGGASPDGRFYAVDDVVVRALGLALILLSVGILLRRRWAFSGGIATLALCGLEVVVTYHWEAATTISLVVTTAMIVVFLGVPVAILTWLRPIMQRS